MTSIFTSVFRLYRDSYSGHPRAIWNLAILTFINRMGTMVLPFLSVYLTSELCFELSDAGFLAGAFGIGSFVGTWVGGKLMDKIGGRKVIFASLILGGVFLFLVQFFTTLWPLAVMIFLASFFGEAYRPPLMASIADFVPKSETGRTFALIRLAINLGFSLGPVFGGLIVMSLGYKYIFWIDGITCILAGIYFWFTSADWKKAEKVEEVDPHTGEKLAKAPSPYLNVPFLVTLLATLFSAIAFLQWFHSVPVFLKGQWNYSEGVIGLLLGFNGLVIALIEMPLIHAVEKRGSRKIFQTIGLVLIALSFAPFLLPKAGIFAFIAVFFFTFGEIFFLPLNNSTLLNMSPASRRGEYMAVYSMMWSVANVVGPSGGLSLAAGIGFTWFWIFIMGLGGIGLYLYMRIMARQNV